MVLKGEEAKELFVLAEEKGVILMEANKTAHCPAFNHLMVMIKSGVKVGMMGPLAGVGDPVFWFTVRPMLGALGASLAMGGNILGPIIFFLGWNIIRWSFMWYTQEFGYKAGSKITDDLSGGLLQDVTKGASILGMFVLAALVQRWVSIKFLPVVSTVKLDKGAYIEWDKLPAGGEGIKSAFEQDKSKRNWIKWLV